MTVIAWDGISLSADKRSTSEGLIRTVTKIFNVEGVVVGCTGNVSRGLGLIEWFKNGAVPSEYPKYQENEDTWCLLVVARVGGVEVYENTPYPIKLEDTIWAGGSGRDFALAAMACGKTSYEAVEIACNFDAGSGNGVTTLYPDYKGLPF